MVQRLLVVCAVLMISTTVRAQIYYGSPPDSGEETTDTGEEATDTGEEATDAGEEATEETDGHGEPAEHGGHGVYVPLAHFEVGGILIEIPVALAERVNLIDSFPVDADGNLYEHDVAFNSQIEVGALIDTQEALGSLRILAEYEHEILSGVHTGGAEEDEAFALEQPDTHHLHTLVRKASLRVSAADVHFQAGITTSSWGLGLVSNDGKNDWEPGSAAFVDPRGGDVVLRILGIVGPVTDAGILFGVGGDSVRHDDVLIEGDEATQLVGFVLAGAGQPNSLGAYMVMRRQDAEDGAFLDVQAVDLAGGYQIENGSAVYRIDGEAVFIWGETSLGPSPDFPVHTVRQLGTAVRASASFGNVGAVLDFLFASGDNNPDDEFQTAMKADRNYEMGLLLYRYVNAAQSGRSAVTAYDPELTGYPSEDLDRLPTRGSVSNTIAFFPRGWWRPIDGLEIYGGPLIALAATDPTDPFHSRIAGGDPRNALNGDPGSYLGTEIDLGIRYHKVLAGTVLTLGIEGAILLPGSALVDADGNEMDSIMGGRAIVRYHF